MLPNELITAQVVELPLCDFQCGETALYDAKTVQGPWGYMCQSCFDKYSAGRLGTGFGQKLEVVK
jgi:hypothetical protein